MRAARAPAELDQIHGVTLVELAGTTVVCAMPNDAGTREEYPALHGKRILVVEDNAVAAVDYHFQLQAVGAAESLQPTVMRALAYLADHEVDAAIVDYQLPDGNCEPVLEQLARRHIPFVIVSGDTFGMREMPSGIPVLLKPVRTAEVYGTLAEVLTAGEEAVSAGAEVTAALATDTG
jgi:CheY-like chemotaxis protein